MKTPLSLVLVVLTGALAFLAGGWSSARGGGAGAGAAVESARASSPGGASGEEAPRQRKTSPGREIFRKGKISRGEIDTEEASRLSAGERLELMKKAAVLGDVQRQADMLRGLISAMTKDELEETTTTLLQVQMRGNPWSPDVWNALWTRWGMVDPVGCLARSEEGRGLNTTEDYRWMMSGWLETDPAAAMAWAKTADGDSQAAPAIAHVITTSAGGDLGKLESAILELSNGRTIQACLHDYFELALAGGGDRSAASVYESLDPSLREDAWPVAMRRLTYTDPKEAARWLEQHVSDPGRDYRAASYLAGILAREDPAGTSEWAARLPLETSGNLRRHPATVAIASWIEVDEAAARAWLRKQPAGSPWVSQFAPITE